MHVITTANFQHYFVNFWSDKAKLVFSKHKLSYDSERLKCVAASWQLHSVKQVPTNVHYTTLTFAQLLEDRWVSMRILETLVSLPVLKSDGLTWERCQWPLHSHKITTGVFCSSSPSFWCLLVIWFPILTSVYRVSFVQMITRGAGISAQSVLLKDVDVVTTSGRATCVEFNMNVFGTGKLPFIHTEIYAQKH